MSASLSSLNAELGARLEKWRGLQVPSTYGNPLDEHGLITRGLGLWDRSWAGALRVTGVDRHRFLNGLITCDIVSLDAGSSAFGFFTDPRGKILAEAAVLARDGDLVLEVPAGQTEAVACHLLRFRVADRVEVEPMSAYLCLTLVGPGSVGVEIGSATAEWRISEVEIGGHTVMVDRRPVWGLPALTLWVLDSDAEEMARRLLSGDRELRPVGLEALNTARVEAGFPLFGQDYGEANFPQETGLEGLAVSHSKGCYLGQEVISRMHHRGLTQRCLVGLELPDVNGGVAEGTVMSLEGRRVGRVTSLVSSWSPGASIGLAIVHRRAAEAGTLLELESGGEAVVASIPRAL